MYATAKCRSLVMNGLTFVSKPLLLGPLRSLLYKLFRSRVVRQFTIFPAAMDKHLKETSDLDDLTYSRLELAYDHKEEEIINIDANKWKDVPPTLDLGIMKHFPLFNSKSKPFKNKEILSIDTFEGGYRKMPSVRNILTDTMTETEWEILVKWESRLIREMGTDKFEKYRQGLLERGDIVHQCIELYFKGEGPHPEHLVGIEDLWNSIIHTLKAITNVKVLESRLVHPALCYQGVIDCVGMYKNKMLAIEFKTSTKPKLILSKTRDNPLQLAAYLGALNYDNDHGLPAVDGALLVIAYPSGLPAHAHYMDRQKSEEYWSLWQKRLIKFWKTQHKE